MHGYRLAIIRLLACALGCLPTLLPAQEIPEWAVRFDGEGGGHDEGHALVADAAGNVYATGASGTRGRVSTA